MASRSCGMNKNMNSKNSTFSICTFNASFAVDVRDLRGFLHNLDAQVVCLQELPSREFGRLKQLLASRYPHSEESPKSRSTILSKLPLEVVSKGGLGGNCEYVVVKVAGVILTCLHLNAKREATRLKQLEKLRHDLRARDLWEASTPHVWAGDFNSLTREDYTDAEMANIALERKRKTIEEPKFTVTSTLADLNFSDCWIELGRHNPRETCR